MPFDGNSEEVIVSPTLQVLIGARDLLVREGWVQKEMRSRHGRCISGAIEDAGRLLEWQQRLAAEADARNILRHTIAPQSNWLQRWLGFGYIWLATWNDVKGRTKEEAVALLDRGIAVARERNK